MSFARVRALVVVGVLVVAAVVLVIVALTKDTQGDPVGDSCPAGAPRVDIELPDDPAQVTVKIYNGTTTPGLADSVTTEFKNRRFTTQKPAENKTRYSGIADIKYGPDAVGKAQLLRAYFLDQSKMEYDAKRKGATIDIVIGKDFRQLATSTEVNQSLAAVGEPTVPPGACAKPATKKKDADS
ncbi:LytR C-terminal domain-containing protein [Actinoplanes sp. NPDC051411]|uniref:LytR C-terminal domain-containing protein n=1 Tax=Actinoplanes sp. NPDC051411 TaxID=3155522 RepID=UPI00342A9371